MKKNGYLRRFLALFLALVMIMADSSVTTFAATVGMVKQKSADTEAETENQQKVYTYEDSKVTVTATLENADAVPDNAKFVVTKMNKADHQEDYVYAEQKLKEYEESENVLYDSYLIYDMHFEDENGNEIEPAEGQVSVNISYKKAQKLSDETTEDSVQVLHLDENLDQLEDVTDNVELNNKGKVEEVTLTTDSFSIFVIASQNRSEIEVEPMTDYSLYNILNNYNTFAKDSVKMGHSVGPVVAGGDYKGDYISGNGYVHKVDSYIKGKASIGGYNPHTNSTYMYLGKVNEWNYSGDQIRYTKNDDYIDFTKAFKSIESEMASVGKSVTNRSVDDNNTLVAGESYNIHLNDYCYYGSLTWKTGTDSTSTDSVVYDDSDGTVYLRVKADALGSAGAEYNPNGVGIVYLFPNAKKIVVSNWYQLMGHIVAPKADIEFDSTMNYAGCLVCKSLDTKGSESHMWPYNGSKIKPTSTGFEATKTVDGATPTENQKFEFTLSEYINDVWQEKETIENNGSSIAFSEIGYSSDAQIGDHWYLITEKQTPVNGYKLSGKQYLVKVTVTKTTSGSDTVYNKAEAYYEGPELPEIAVPNSSELKLLSSEAAMVFDNETNNTETTKVEGTKTWDDNENQDGKRPEKITVNLLADGNQIQSQEVKPDENGNWSYSFDNLPKYAGGKEIKYSVTEKAVDGYTSKVTGNAETGFIITNTHTPETTKVEGTKTWDDEDNQDGLRPGSITVNLLADGEKVATKQVEPDAKGEWKYSFDNLDKYKEGKLIKYTVSEEKVDGYTMSVEGTNIINSHIPGKTGITVTKAWDDKEDQDGLRPEEIKVQLYADGKEAGEEVTLTAAEGWTYSWTDLDAKKAGKDIVYTVKEVGEVSGYIATEANAGNNYTITNSHTPEKTSISGTKTWDDEDNQDGLRPGSITVNLLADGEKVATKQVEPDAKGEWKYSFDNLDKYKEGKLIKYTVSEEKVDGYTMSVEGTNIINSHIPGKTGITVTKAWDDKEDQDGLRPEEIKVQLYADGKEAGEEVTLTAAEGWTYSWTDLDAKKAGKDIVYTVKEVGEVSGYIATEANAGNNYTITNSHTPEKTSISGTKTWDDEDNQDGLRPGSITVNLLADGEKVATKQVEPDAKGEWKYSFDNLDKYKEGKLIKYTVSEEKVDGYTMSVEGTNIINSHIPGKTGITVTKAWDDKEDQDGLRPEEIKVQLYADGKEAGEEVTLTAAEGWTYSWTDLDAKKAGKDIVYTVKEVGEVSGYIATEANAGNNYTITNSHTPEKTSISGTKTWDDEDNQDGLRPGSITVNLLADGEKVATKQVEPDAKGEWKYSFDNLDKYKEGKLIKYTVSEEKVDGYTMSVEGTNIINSHIPGKTGITVTKAWDDKEDQDGLRPEEIKVQLYADGKEAGEEVTLTAAEGWTYSWTDLDAKKAGKDIVYTVKEVGEVSGYIATEANAGNNYTITNSHTPEKTSISGTKTWDDEDNQDGLRPGSITVNLLADGEKVATKQVEPDAKGEWKYSFDNLDKYKEGKLIKYTVSEEKVDGYTMSVEGTNIINSHIPGKTGITVTKAWDDKEDQDGLRPEEIKVQLYADGKEAGEEVTLTAAEGWTYSWTDLDAKKAGKDIVYTVKEVGEVSGYIATEANAGNNYTITNSHTPEKTSISGTKTWDDEDNQDGLRPGSITVNLLADGEKVATKQVEPDAKGEWKYSFDNLDKFNNGKEIIYTVEEEAVKGYETKVDGYNIANTHKPENVSITGTKTWDDANNQDGKRPTSIKINLLANGNVVKSLDVTAATNWNYSFTDLPKYEAGTEIKYTVEEEAVAGYETKVEDYNITNTHKPETTSITGTKTWNDSDNQDGKRPESITVNLLADGKITATKTVTAKDNWTYSFTDLPKYANGQEITYTVTENAVEGYTTELDGNNIINTHQPETTEITGTKTWNDTNNQDGKRPESITVNLLANGKTTATKTVTAADDWTYSFTDLPKYANGEEITYSVSEEPVPEYTTTYNKYDITNSYTPGKTSATVAKIWDDVENQDGKRPESITVSLLADGKATGTTVILNAENDWTQTVSDLPEKADGKAIEYTWKEETLPEGYKLTDTSKNGTVTTLTNTYVPETVSISGTKTWDDANNQDGKRPTSIKINLLANGNVVKSLDVTAATNWNYSFADLPKYEAGTEIKYTVEEEAVAGYETKVEDYNITNTHKPETTSITGTKTWDDAENQDGKRPESITVNLLADGKITATKTVTAKDNWTYSFTDLPKYANGQEITYTVNEIPVPEYTTTYNNYDITNSYTPGQTSASVTKIWADADNQDGIRPESITVALLADGKATDTTVTLNAANNWTQTVTGLPEKADGEYITYTWTEVNVPEGYSLTGTSKTGIVTTLTNTHTPELTSISGTKTWNDADNQDGKRPESITVNLFANGTLLTSQNVSADADGNWNYSFTDLPKYANGQEITYTVTEDAVEGYTTEFEGNNIINTHQPETTEITGTKTWNDANNQDGKRPESITVILLANGTEKDRQTVTADEAGNWTYTFKELPKYANGQEITYTVAEEEVTDYTTTYDGNNITNSYTPGKTSATVTKIWNDAENQDGKRPESITVSLLADGEATGETVTLSAENNWTQTVSDLPEKANGKAIEYTWTEETLPEGYELTDTSKNGTVTTLTNTYAPETTSITGTKTWDDADNQDGKRPESIIINLLANGEIAASQTVTADGAGNWTYTFTDLPKYVNGEEITYTVTEEAVEGYETSVDGFNITNAYTTETTEVKGSKTWNDADDQDGKRPESITVRLLANGEEKDSKTVTADENGNWTYSFENLPKYEAGKEIVYTVTEDAVADYTTEITGYDITNSYAPGKTSVTVTKAWADNNDRDGHRPKEIKVQLKADGENSGEEITLNAENKWTYTWSDLDQKKAGKDIVYTVEETSETTGYISAVTGDAAEGFVITNTITSVKISKVDITDQKELAGAHIQVIDKDGNVVDEWDSTWESHEVTGLKTGEKYTLRETVAPDGYTVTTDTTFVLKEDGTLDKDNTSTTIADDGRLLVEDSRTSVKVSKVDISDGEELEGAHIQIIDGDGNIVDEWDSTKEAHVTEKLKTGKTYTLRETVAPDGYLLTTDTTFVLKEDGTVDAEKTTTVSKDGVLLVQDSLATSASIAVTKRLTYVGENLAAKDQTFYVALYSDEECTKRVSDVKALEFKNSNASTVVFSENIKAGKTYYIAECTKDGISQVIGALADGTTYEAVFGDGNSTTVTEADGTTTVSFENVFSSFPPDGFYRQGQLTITKRVLGADGDTKNSDKVFYAGIFDDAAHTQLSQQVEQNIIELKMDGGYEVSEIINVGLAQPGTKVTLYVTETDSNGKPIAGSEDFGYKVSVSADSVTIDDTNMTAEVVITNQEEATETPTPTPSSDDGNGGGSEDHSGSYGGKSPKTGDDTPIGTYLMLLLAAAMLAAETERRRRRNKR